MVEPPKGKEMLKELVLRVEYYPPPPGSPEAWQGAHQITWLAPSPEAIFRISEQTWTDLWDFPFGTAMIELYKMARQEAAWSAARRERMKREREEGAR